MENQKETRLTPQEIKEIYKKYEEILLSVLKNETKLTDEEIEELSKKDIFKLTNKKMIELSKEIKDKKDNEKLDNIIPINYIIPNNKMINKLSSGELTEDVKELIVIDKPKKEVTTKVSLNYDDDNIEIFDKNKRFTPYDRTVHNAVCSIFDAGNTNFTPNQVYRCMNGLNDNEKVTPQAIGAVTKSLDKARRIYAKVDYTDEMKAYNKNIDNCIIEDNILSAKKITLEAGGNEVTGYKINNKPILYEYAQSTGQVLTISSELLNTKDVLRSTPEVTIIREYLIRRIEVMKRRGNKKQSNKIKLLPIYQEIGQEHPTKQKAQRIRENTEKLLISFKNNKYIKGYEFYKKSRSFEGIEIFY